MPRRSKRRRSIIVKVQLPVVTTDAVPHCLIYDRRRTVEAMFPITPAVRRMVKDQLKSFCYAHLIPDPAKPRGVIVSLDGRAPWQEW